MGVMGCLASLDGVLFGCGMAVLGRLVRWGKCVSVLLPQLGGGFHPIITIVNQK